MRHLILHSNELCLAVDEVNEAFIGETGIQEAYGLICDGVEITPGNSFEFPSFLDEEFKEFGFHDILMEHVCKPLAELGVLPPYTIESIRPLDMNGNLAVSINIKRYN